MRLSGRVETIVEGVLRGWAWDASRPGLRLDVTLLADGRPIGTVRADRARGDLRRNGIGDGLHGFEFRLPSELLDGAVHLFALHVVAEGASVELARRSIKAEPRRHRLRGRLERVEPLRLAGWAADEARPDRAVTLELVAAGEVLARAEATRFRADLLAAGIGSGAHGFVFDLAPLLGRIPAGTELIVRASAEFDHWELARVVLPPATRLRPPAASPPESATPILPTQPDIFRLIAEAREAERRRDLPLAAAFLDEALAVAPTDFELLALRARVALALHADEDAERFAHAALAERPGHPRALVILARVASRRGDHAAAAELWSAIGPGEDGYRERLVKRGRALAALGRPREAMAEFAAAVALDPADCDAQRGLAEVAFAIGALATARRHWRRYQELAPEDPSAAERLRAIEAVLSQQAELPSALRNPTLREWPGALAGVADRKGVEPSPGVRLRSLDHLEVRFAPSAPMHLQPGSLAVYGLSFEIAGEGAEAAFALDPRAGRELAEGVRLGLEMTASVGTAIAIRLDGPGGLSRALAAAELPSRPRLIFFDLALSREESLLLASGGLWLAIRIAGAGACEIAPPRLLCRRPVAAARSGRTGFEDPRLASAPWSAWQPPTVQPPAGGRRTGAMSP